ncbi:MAG TPA: tetratricopeptide repeat protein, partial [Candidatus Krumholzibacterium sp.]|nr:tetratricopeptide repeat protein [Candidatus Krumholzibacterium sp.]
KTWVLNFTILLLSSLGLIIFLNFSDQEVRERDYFYGGAFYFFAVFIGIGATSLLKAIQEKVGSSWKRSLLPAAAAIVACSILPATHHWRTHDRSADFIPVDYAYNILAGLEPDAIIFTNGDNDTFPLWYLQYVEGYRKDVRVANLSLLNTPWYIKQIRDNEPVIPVHLDDREIELLRPVRTEDGVLWTRDLAVNHIIRSVDWRRPVYFSVTVPTEVWERYSDYLEMQGMVRRMIPRTGSRMVNEFQTARNLEEIFRYRGFLVGGWKRDDSTYMPLSVENMFINYSIAAFQVAQLRSQDGDDEGAVRWAERSYTFAPRFEWPKKYLGIYYMRNGQYEKAAGHYMEQLRIDPARGDFWMGLANVYEKAGDLERAVEALREGSFASPDHKDLFGHGFRISAMLGRRDDAVEFVSRWVQAHPEDREFKSLLDDIDKILYEEFGVGKAADTAIDGGTE